MRRKFFVLMLSAVLCLSFTACNKAETSSSENKSVIKQRNDDSKSKEENSNEDKTIDDKKVDKKEIAKVDDDVLKFTSHYIEVFGTDGEACMDIKFDNDDFIPSEVRKKIDVIGSDLGDNRDNSGQGKIDKHLIINFHDGALYRVSTMADNANDIKTIKNFYLAKGDAFILDLSNEQYTVDIFSADDINGQVLIMTSEIAFESGAVKEYSVYRWEAQKKPSDFITSYGMVSEEECNQMDAYVDLDGDGVNDSISYVVKRGKPEFKEENEVVPSRFNKLTINDKEFDLDKYDLVGQLQDLDYMINIRIVDLDKKDKYKEIAIERPGEHFNLLTDIFRYDNGELSHMGSMECVIDRFSSAENSDNYLVMNMDGGYFGFNYTFDSVYSLKDGQITPSVQDSKKIYNHGKKIIVTVKEDVNFYSDKSDEKASTVLKKGDVVEFIETDEKSWIKVKSEQTGKVGYILLTFEPETFKVNFKDQEELNKKIDSIRNVFEELPQWG